MWVPKINALRGRTRVLALSTEELNQRILASWSYHMVASSHQLCAKIRNHHSGGWECIVIPRSMSLGVFLFLGACLAAISDLVSLLALVRDYWLD